MARAINILSLMGISGGNNGQDETKKRRGEYIFLLVDVLEFNLLLILILICKYTPAGNRFDERKGGLGS